MNDSALTLNLGDRVPNFVLPNHQGSHLMFYNRTKGGPVLLFLYRRNADPGARREVEAFVEHRAELDALGAEIFVINRDSAKNNAALVAGHALAHHVLSDPANKITAALAAAVGAIATPADERNLPNVVLVLDRNQRLLRALGPAEESLAARAVEVLRRDLPTTERHELFLTAPVLMLPNMLDPATCRQLIEIWRTQGHQEGSVVSTKGGEETRSVEHGMMKRLDHMIRDDAVNTMVAGKVGPRIADEVFKAFVYEGFVLERFLIGAYEAARGDYFRPHRDNLNPHAAGRRFALSLNLNDDYEGGGVVFPEYGPHVYNMTAGTALIFSCSLIHEALPVARGRRFVLFSFLSDAQNRPHPWSYRAD
jgi:peroxiredoxin/predicted 2-oxoglutarate/Fe(II)-dependent dioxygenase YbiX